RVHVGSKSSHMNPIPVSESTAMAIDKIRNRGRIAPASMPVSAQETPRDLLQSLVVRALRVGQQRLHVGAEARLTPVVACRAFGELRLVHPGGLEQRPSCGKVEAGIVPGWQVVIAARHLAF